MFNQIITNLVGCDLGTMNHQWNMNTLLVKELLAAGMAYSMVGPEKDDGVVEDFFILESLNELTKEFVSESDGIEVGGPVISNHSVVRVVGRNFKKRGVGICGFTKFLENEVVPVFTFPVFAPMDLYLGEEGLIIFSSGPIIAIINFRIEFKIIVGFSLADLRECAVGGVITSLLKKDWHWDNPLWEIDFNASPATAVMLGAYGGLVHAGDHRTSGD